MMHSAEYLFKNPQSLLMLIGVTSYVLTAYVETQMFGSELSTQRDIVFNPVSKDRSSFVFCL